MDFIKIVFILFYFAQFKSLLYCQTFDNISYLKRQLQQVEPDLHPRLNQNEPINVSIFAYISSILDYNEVSGTLQVVTSYMMVWTDEIRRWNTSEYGNVTSVNLPISSTWIPKISIVNTVRHKSIFMYHNEMEIGKSYVSYNSSGYAVFQVSGVQELSCSSNVKYFPIDSHACSIQLSTTQVFDSTILKPVMKTIDLTYGVPNPKWSITENFVESNVDDYTSKVNFHITLSRNPSFLFLNLVVPIFLLSFANLLVFCIPVSSGERGSLAFTILLTFVVFITLVTDILPACKPISYFNIFLEVQLFCSVLITFCAVWSISLHHKFTENDTQEILPQLLLQMSCAYRNSCSKYHPKGKKNQVVPPRGIIEEHCNETCVDKNAHLQKEPDLHEDIKSGNNYTKDIHQYCLQFIDLICFRLFLFILCIQLIVYCIIFSFKP
ncbi:CHRNA7 [Mytilus coruscus]|uniref:CHRNA7 n=1 Tax=Mytilus coruscus TaxID=42192 RepID=A0A6J8F1L9_MYTCO|nr:CHRNA7 [Mytilus coruscus]